MKLLKRIVLAFIILLLLAVGLVTVLLDPNDFRQPIAEAASKELGVDVHLEGEMGWSFWPNIGIRLGGLKVDNAPGYSKEPLLTAENITVSMQLLPLLRQEVLVDTVQLDKVQLFLEAGKTGKGNWEHIGQGESASRQSDSKESNSAAVKVALSSFVFSGGKLQYRDMASDQTYTIKNVDLVLKGFEPGQTSAYTGSFVLEGEQAAKVSFSGQIKADETFREINLPQTRVQLALDGMPDELDINADLSYNSETGVADIRSATVGVLDGSIRISGQASADSVNLHATAEGIDPGVLKEQLSSIETGYLTPVAFDLKASGKTENMKLELAKFSAGELAGKASVSLGEKIEMTASLDKLDIDALQKSAVGEAAASDPEQALLTPADMPDLNLRADFTLNQLKASGLLAENITARITLRPGQVYLDSLKADFYQGKVDVRSSLSVAEKKVFLNSSGSMEGVQIEGLQKDLLEDAWVSGQSRVEWVIQAPASSEKALIAGLEGQAGVRMEDGALLGVNVAELIREAYASYKGLPYEKPETPPKTDFSELSATMQIRQGVINNQDFLMKSPLLRVTGKGNVNLPEESVYYEIQPTIVGTLKGQNGESMEELKGVPIPVYFKGPLAEPKIRLDLKKLITESKKEELKEKATKKLYDALFGKEDKKKEQKPDGS